jgi:hypothetical protein
MAFRFAKLPIEGQTAAIEWAEFMSYFGELCVPDGEVLNCADDKEIAIEDELDDVQRALQACGTDQCQKAGDSLVNFLDSVYECMDELPEAYTQMIRLTIPNVGDRDQLQKDVYELQANLKNWTNTEEFNNLRKSAQNWSFTPEFQNFSESLKNFANSTQGRELAEEIQEALATLKNVTVQIENGVYIPNDQIPEILEEFADVI